MILTRRRVEQGDKVPWGYGFAWRDFSTHCWFAYPVPFNVLFRNVAVFGTGLLEEIKAPRLTVQSLEDTIELVRSTPYLQSLRLFNSISKIKRGHNERIFYAFSRDLFCRCYVSWKSKGL